MYVSTPEDRSLVVPPGAIVRTGYVTPDQVTLACSKPTCPSAVEPSFRRQLSLGASQAWPPPVGEWRAERFFILDGRHAFHAALMLGMTHILVAWLEPEALLSR